MENSIRNFAIIAHIDHGKSTLADRFLELTGTIEKRKMKEQFLDTMELERERGITIKLQPVRMAYRLSPIANGQAEEYVLNLIDTPGHVDFSYEVSRSLAAVEGAILLVDATKGVQAQTLANLSLAQQQGLTIVPAINKIDLPGARVAAVEEELRELLEGRKFSITPPSLSPSKGESENPSQPPFAKGGEIEIYKISGKEGIGIEELLQAVIAKIPPPKTDTQKPCRALVFDSNYDVYKGVLAYVRLVDGEIKRGDKIMFMASGAKAEAIEIGIFTPALKPAAKLSAGDIGYIATGLKEVALCRVGDTITSLSVGQSVSSSVKALPGYKEPRPMVFASFYPALLEKQEAQDYNLLRDALGKLKFIKFPAKRE